MHSIYQRSDQARNFTGNVFGLTTSSWTLAAEHIE
jgi:hypothetical protein